MKIRHFLILLPAITLALSLSACGDKAEPVSTPAAATEPPAANDADDTAAPADASATYELDYASSEMQEMSAERATEETLVSVYHDWFKGELDAAAQAELTYEDFAARIGCDASWYNAWGEYRVFTWEADGAPSVKVGATLEEIDGVWKCKYFNGNNIGAS